MRVASKVNLGTLGPSISKPFTDLSTLLYLCSLHQASLHVETGEFTVSVPYSLQGGHVKGLCGKTRTQSLATVAVQGTATISQRMTSLTKPVSF